MARLLVRLKLRLIANTLHRGFQPAVGFVLAMVFGLGFGVLGAVLLSAAATTTVWPQVVTLTFAGLWVGWLVLPVLTFSSDETLDPRRFALLPIRPRALVPGLLAAGLVGVGPIATTIAAAGVVPGASRAGGSPAGVAISLVAVVLLVASCIASSRALTTAASNVLASRRGRDIAALAAGLLAILFYVAFQGMTQLTTATEFEVSLDGPAAAARFLPGGLAGAAVGWAADGEYGPASLALLGTIGWILAALGVWAWAVERVDRRQPIRSASPVRDGRTGLYPAGLRWLPRGRTTAVTVRFLRGLARDTRVRTQALQHIFFLLPMLMVSITSGVLTTEYAPLLAALFVLPLGMIAANQLGLDGPALWLHELAGARPVADLLGRNLALGIVAAPPTIVAAVGLAAWTGGWTYVPAALLLSLATMGLVLAPANIGSVLLPIPVPEQTNNLFGARQSGQGCVNGFLSIGILAAQGLLMLPLLVALFFAGSVTGRTIVAAVGVLYAAVVLGVGTRIAAGRLARCGPELLVAIDPG